MEHEDEIMETRRSLRLDQKRKDQKGIGETGDDSDEDQESWKEKPSSYSNKRRKSSIGSEITNVSTETCPVDDKDDENEEPPKVPTSKTKIR